VQNSESLQKFQAHYSEKARQMQEYLQSESSLMAEDVGSDVQIDYDAHSNFEDYYYFTPKLLSDSPVDQLKEPSPTGRGASGGTSSNPSGAANASEKLTVSPLDKLVFPIARGYQTVKNLVYTYSGGHVPHSRSRSSTSPASSGPNSLDESFFFIQPDDLASVEAATPLVPSDIQPELGPPSSPRIGAAPAQGAINPNQVLIDRNQYQQLVDEITMLRTTVMKLRDQNSKLVQRAQPSGMQTLVRENTALKRSLISLQKRSSASGIWTQSSDSVQQTPSSFTAAAGPPSDVALSPLSLSEISHLPQRVGVQEGSSLKEENERLRRENENMKQKVQAWKDRWSKLKSTALQKQQRRSSESGASSTVDLPQT
jgi:FtsZ-binding cell division protein ZapB